MKNQTLHDKYPNLVRKNLHFECGDGWYTLLNSLLSVINNHRANKEFDFYIVQVKEKFGGLRFYYNGGDDFVSGAVAQAENMSYNVCEVCGEKGIPTIKNNWRRTLCNSCKFGFDTSV